MKLFEWMNLILLLSITSKKKIFFYENRFFLGEKDLMRDPLHILI